MIHTWKIYDLKRSISDGVVSKVTYACESALSGSSTREINDLEVEGSTSDVGFIEFENLNEGDVLAWVTSSIDTAPIETQNSSSIAKQIERQAARTHKNGTPW